MQAYHNIPTEERFMQILYNYGDSSMEEKRFLIVNCDNVFQDRDDVSFYFLNYRRLRRIFLYNT